MDKIGKFFHRIRQLFWPKTMEYFQIIGHIIDSIDSNRKKNYFQLLIYFLCYESLRSFLIYSLPLSYDQRIWMFDPAIFMHTTNETNLMLFINIVAIIYVYKDFFSINNRCLNRILIDIVCGNNRNTTTTSSLSKKRYLNAD